MASMDNVDESIEVADEAVCAEPAYANPEGTEMTTISKSSDKSYSATRVTSEEDWGTELERDQTSVVTARSNVVEEPCVKFIAQDETNTDWTKSRLTYSLPLSSAVTDLCSCIAKEAGYTEETFDLVWRRQDVDGESEEEVHLSWNSTATLHEMGMPSEPLRCYLLIREKPDGTRPKRITETEKKVSVSETAGSSASDLHNTTVSTASSSQTNYRTTPAMTSSGSWYNYKYNAKSDTGYVGLVNQAMTCYLNSLLQTLYMTPEFRNAVYHWEFGGNREEGTKSIPYQLQRLFLHLQTSEKRAVETTDVTKSFGWDSSEAWQQHDVQELCRVMFDALEKRFRKDGYESSKDLINELYQGNMKDYVKCLECEYESAREDSFLDIPLVIKPFGSSTTHTSVEEALSAFVTPETLDGDNQYFCEHCNKKCDAHKGLKFKRFPYLLTLQLKRFDFDYSTMHRIKLNDRMTFPTILNLNEYVNGDGESDSDSSPPSEEELSKMYSDFVVEKFDQKPLNNSPKPPPYSSCYTSSSVDSTSLPEDDVITGETVAKLLAKGPYVYELFSIMVHSGSAIGGHYYAYIKSFSDRQWYCFNDQSVSRITKDDLEQTFGGSDGRSRGYYSAVYASSANAYMLMYRRIDKKFNDAFTLSDQLPKHILRQIEEEKEAERKERELQEYEKNLCKFRLFCRHPVTRELVEKRLEVHKDTSLKEVVAEAHKLQSLVGVVPIERCRLVRYDEYTETLDQSFDDDPELPTFGTHVGGARTYYSFELFLEIREEGEEFRPYNKSGLNLKVLIIDLPEGSVREPLMMRGEQTWKVKELKSELARRYGLDETTMNLALQTYNDQRKHLPDDENVLRSESFFRRHTIYVCCDRDDLKKEFSSSKMYEVSDRHANATLLLISIPPPLVNKRPQTEGRDEETGAGNTAADADLVNHQDMETESADVAVSGQNGESGEAGSKVTGTPKDAVETDRQLRRTIELRIDRRCTLAELKTRLEEYVQVPTSEFKIYRRYSDAPEEYEMIRLEDNLKSLTTETKLVVRRSKVIKEGEVGVKVSLLDINSSDLYKPILDSTIVRGMTVRRLKEQLVQEAYEQGVGVQLSPDTMRLRKKTWRSPCTIYLDSQVFDKDIHVFANFEIYIECLNGPDGKTDSAEKQVYVRQWHPSTYTVDKTKEIILSDNSPEHLKLKLSELSGIPVERVEFAKAYGSFPCEMSVLDIDSDLEWNPSLTTISSMPLSIYDDGSILYLKDSKEQLPELSAEKRAEIQNREGNRLVKHGTSSRSSGSSRNYHYRRDDALQIKDWSEDEVKGDTKRRQKYM